MPTKRLDRIARVHHDDDMKRMTGTREEKAMEMETAHEDLLASIESLSKTALKVKRDRDTLLVACQAYFGEGPAAGRDLNKVMSDAIAQATTA